LSPCRTRAARDLRRALEACHGVDDRGGRWKIVATRVAGPDSVLLRVRDDFQDAGDSIARDTYVAVAGSGACWWSSPTPAGRRPPVTGAWSKN